MTRPLRIEFSGALYHLTGRGNAGEPICRDDTDRESFVAVLSQVVRRFEWQLYAYCLMGNHYHLLVETPHPNLSRGMRQLNGVYTQTFNRRHAQPGHVFQGRYKAVLVEREKFFLEIARHIVLNPIRFDAQMKLANYQWSSYLATSGFTSNPSWLNSGEILSRLSASRNSAQQRYIEFVDVGIRLPTVWAHLKQQIYLGDNDFIAELQTRFSNHTNASDLSRLQTSPPPKTLSAYTNAYARTSDAMAAAYRSGHYSLKAIAQHLGLHYSTVSRMIKNGESNL